MTMMRRHTLRHATIVVVMALATVSVSRQPKALDSGKEEIKVRVQGVNIAVFTYRPYGCEVHSIVFAFHGLGRKAGNIRDNAIPLADRACLLLVAPLFDKERFPNWRYHRAGVVRQGRVQPRGRWTRPIVDDLISWGREWAGDAALPYILFGHSAGAQFLSRLAAYSPLTNARRIVIANASVHVVPALDEEAPYGFGGFIDGDEGEASLKAYLALPITIYLGDQDTGAKNLVKRPAANRQGTNRLERGLHVFRVAWALAKVKNWPLSWRLVTAAGVGHSSKDMLSAATAENALGLEVRADSFESK